ncbi:hypothetical protein DDZ13_03875 [Coraliomargarita sinensis]|uniref:Lipoprotein n=1 Tax=Coraliomargarita sinensis TaxID=2174842 RepID=A0A317ZHZ8_9BACT|nr:hypothetical protein [Coraliomargarita sinensis]PXA05110.1 hypothetical protein DDZ13_03875 [Coraliomargarita sinensis]
MKQTLALLMFGTLALTSGCSCLPKGYTEERSVIKNAQGEWEMETRKRYHSNERDDESDWHDKPLEQLAKEPIDASKLFSRPGPEDHY